MNAPLFAAGCLGILAAAIHGIAGEILVVRNLALEKLSSSPFGGRRMTKAMIHVTWHVTTFAFLVAGATMAYAGATLDGGTARTIAIVGAVAFTGYGAIALTIGLAYLRSPRHFLAHPGPIALSTTAVLAWLGAF